MRLATAIIPEGCTGKVQAPDVSWKRSFQAKQSDFHDDWMINITHVFTSGGNMRPLTFVLIVNWIKEAY